MDEEGGRKLNEVNRSYQNAFENDSRNMKAMLYRLRSPGIGWLPALASMAVMSIVACVLAAWSLGIHIPDNTGAGKTPMQPNAAAALLMLSAALLCEIVSIGARFRRVLAFAALAIGAATLIQVISGVDLRIDQILFSDPVQRRHPGRMGHLSAMNLVLVGLAMVRGGGWGFRGLRTTLALTAATTALFAIVGYLYGVPLLYGADTAMAPHTAVSFLLLALAVVFADRASTLSRIARSDLAGGIVARQLLPLAVVVPIALGSIFTAPILNLNDVRMGLALQSMSSVIVFTFIVAQLCRSLNAASKARLAAEKTLMLDGLTGIYSRRYFDRRIADAMQRSRRYGTPMSVVLFDADHFKKINDVHGHVAGDEVLRSIAAATSRTLRPSDAVCRYGGEEFALILPQTPLEEAEIIAERVRTQVLERVESDVGIRVTVSLGISEFVERDTNPTEIITRADAALYEAKAAGRNCIRTRTAVAAADVAA